MQSSGVRQSLNQLVPNGTACLKADDMGLET